MNTGSVYKHKLGLSKTTRIPEKVEIVWKAVLSVIPRWGIFFLPKLEVMNVADMWFQQDGATASTARISMSFLGEHFHEHLISLRCDLEWLARSLDLPPCNFFNGNVLNTCCIPIVQKFSMS